MGGGKMGKKMGGGMMKMGGMARAKAEQVPGSATPLKSPSACPASGSRGMGRAHQQAPGTHTRTIVDGGVGAN